MVHHRMLFIATALSFLDRQVLSTLAPSILKEFGITNTMYSRVLFMFQLSYTIMSALGGYLIDRVGVKRGLGISLAVWSAASAAHAWARNVVWLAAARFLLGIGEGACFPRQLAEPQIMPHPNHDRSRRASPSEVPLLAQ